MIKAVVDLTQGIKPTVTLNEPDSKYIVNDFIYCKPGIFDHLTGFQELVKLSGFSLPKVKRSKGIWSNK